MANIIHKNRENWLQAAVELMVTLFERKGYKIPPVRVSCGWPHNGGTRANKRTIGQCWANEAAKDGINQIFISPWLEVAANDQGVLATLVHEVVHAVVGIKEKHNKVFGKCARAVGLEGKLTATIAGVELIEQMEAWMVTLGDYPHSQLDLLKSPVKKQSTRMLKCECQVDGCEFIVRVSKKCMVEVGIPHCPRHGQMHTDTILEDEGEGDGEGEKE